ncbi:hypothetical protein ACJMK2_037459 [Sinanodonta woodiana]|uniref:Uncharacterized protein n=1 Tax=Sinanodonta woodiana TaxID=1069815 RepID=A0ABD3WNZ1_SINWO
MYVPPIVISEKIRGYFAKSIGVLHCVCLIPSFTVLALGGLIESNIRNKIRFIENYNGAILPALLLSIGATSVIAHFVCGKICWTNHNPIRRRLWSRYLLPAMIVSTVIFLLELVSGVLCYSHVTELDKSLKSGILTNMKDYKDDVNVKEEIDVLQIELSCCGSVAYTDWFRTAWIHEDYLNDAKLQALRTSGFEDGFISDDVPFSCCSPTSMRPCIHHHVHDNDLHYNYDYRKSMTINTKGCAITLMEYYGEWVLMTAGAIVICLSLFQVILIALTRILQTSISQSLSADNPEAPVIGYLCSCDCTRPKDILSIPHIWRQSRGSSKKEKSFEKQTGKPEIEFLLPADVQEYGDSFDSSFDDIDDTLSPVNLPVDNIPVGGQDHREYINDPNGRSGNSKYVHDPLYENVQTRTDVRDGRVTNVPLEEPLYENLPNREDKLYELIDVDEEHIYHDEEVERYLREREEVGANDNVKNEDTPLYENFYNTTHTDLGHPNTSSHFGEMMQKDQSNLDENISFHSIVSVPTGVVYPPQYMTDHKQDHTKVQKSPRHHNDMNMDVPILKYSCESLVSGRQPISSNTPSPPPTFSTPQQTPPPPPTSLAFHSDPPSEHHQLSFHSSSQKDQKYQPLYQQTRFTDVRPKEGQHQLPPPRPPPPPTWITKTNPHDMSENNPNKTKNAAEKLPAPRRGSLFKVHTSTGRNVSMLIQDRVDN